MDGAHVRVHPCDRIPRKVVHCAGALRIGLLSTSPFHAIHNRAILCQMLIVSPWNYPVSLVLVPIVSALAAGNAIVLKPSELSPNTALELGRLIQKYLDNDAIQVVQVRIQ